MAVTNFNYRLNYTEWTLVAQHPNLNNITQVFSFDYKPLVAYQSISKFLMCSRTMLMKVEFDINMWALLIVFMCRWHWYVLWHEVLQWLVNGSRAIGKCAVWGAYAEGQEHLHIQAGVGVSSEGLFQWWWMYAAPARRLPISSKLWSCKFYFNLKNGSLCASDSVFSILNTFLSRTETLLYPKAIADERLV